MTLWRRIVLPVAFSRPRIVTFAASPPFARLFTTRTTSDLFGARRCVTNATGRYMEFPQNNKSREGRRMRRALRAMEFAVEKDVELLAHDRFAWGFASLRDRLSEAPAPESKP